MDRSRLAPIGVLLLALAAPASAQIIISGNENKIDLTSDGKYLVVQCHADRELWVFSVSRGRVKDTGQRIKVPGMPSSLRASR